MNHRGRPDPETEERRDTEKAGDTDTEKAETTPQRKHGDTAQRTGPGKEHLTSKLSVQPKQRETIISSFEQKRINIATGTETES